MQGDYSLLNNMNTKSNDIKWVYATIFSFIIIVCLYIILKPILTQNNYKDIDTPPFSYYNDTHSYPTQQNYYQPQNVEYEKYYCSNCNGSGQVIEQVFNGSYNYTCPYCSGYGYFNDILHTKCLKCNGEGIIREVQYKSIYKNVLFAEAAEGIMKGK